MAKAFLVFLAIVLMQQNLISSLFVMGHGPQVAVTAPLVARQTGIKTVAAVHSQCRLWVKRCVAFQSLRRPLSVVGPRGDKMVHRGKRNGAPSTLGIPFHR